MPGAIMGGSGYVVQAGRFRGTDQNTEVQEELGYGTPWARASLYDKMLRTWPCASLLMRLIEGPITSLNWDFRYPQRAKADDKILDFLRWTFFDNLEGGFPLYLGQIARGTPAFGHMAHEVEEGVVASGQYRGAVVPLRLLQRMPYSVIKIQRENERLASVTQRIQRRDDGAQEDVTISAEAMLWDVNGLEGDHFTGVSFLRPGIGPWLNTMDLWRYSGIGFFRAAVPVPWAKLGTKEDWDDDVLKDDLAGWMRLLSSDPNAFLLLPPGAEVGALKIDLPSDAIIQMARYYSWEMLSIGLGQFLALGTTDTGSRAVGDVHSRVYWRSLRRYVFERARAINDTSARAGRGTIKRIIDMNFGPQDHYPYLYAAVPRADTMEAYASAMSSLVNAKLVKPTLDLQHQIREEQDLPPLTPEEMIAAAAELAGEKGDDVFAYHLNSGAVLLDEVRSRIGLGPDPDRRRGAMTVPEYLAQFGPRAPTPTVEPAP